MTPMKTPEERAAQLGDVVQTWSDGDAMVEVWRFEIAAAIRAAVAEAIKERDERWERAVGSGLQTAEENARAMREIP